MSFARVCLVAVGAGAVLIGGGCGSSEKPRYKLSGSVTYTGQPVPSGSIRFEPDASKGNNGVGTSAEIKGGKFQTLSGEGHVGGPHKVVINGADGVPYEMEGGMMNPVGKSLFDEYSTDVDLPKQSGTHDFVVP